MQLMTKEIEDALKKHPFMSQDGKGGKAKVIVKYFGGPAATWLITEGKPMPRGDWILYGLVTLGLPDQFSRGNLLWEWGTVTLHELQEAMFIERDLSVKPCKQAVKDLVFMCSLFED